jgi:hypothetical protein
MFDPTAMIMADTATRQHVRSAHPKARLTVATLRRLADHVEPRHGGDPLSATR